MGAPRIRKLRRRGNVDGLVEALGYADPVSFGGGRRGDAGVPVRLRALRALAEVASPEDAPSVAVALRDTDPAVRQAAARVVRSVDARGAVDLLAAAAVGPGAAEFAEARLEALEVLEALARQGEPGAARRIALAAVGGDEVAMDQLTHDALTGFLAQAPKEELAAVVGELIDRLPAMNGSLERAQVVLTWLAPHSVEPLIEVLDREGGFREPAAAVLGAIRDSRALEPLVGVLRDRRADVRRVAVWALGELRDPRTAEALMGATMDDEYVVRCQAGEALDAMGSVALMAGVANMIRSLEDHSDRSAVDRLVEEGLERTPSSARSRAATPPRWVPRFVERFQTGRPGS